MVNYMDYLQKYSEIILRLVAATPRIPIGDLVERVNKEARGMQKSKSEIRDAILLLVGTKRLRIEMVTPKRLEVLTGG